MTADQDWNIQLQYGHLILRLTQAEEVQRVATEIILRIGCLVLRLKQTEEGARSGNKDNTENVSCLTVGILTKSC